MPEEAFNTGAGDGSMAIMRQRAFNPPTIRWTPGWRGRWNAVLIMAACPKWRAARAHHEGAAGQWRSAFIRMPYGREKMTPRSISDTFETAITWDRFETFHGQVKAAAEQAIRDATGRPGQVTCRFTHVYPDGPAPYFSFPRARPARCAN